MNWILVCAYCLSLLFVACGVKGKPQPPLSPIVVGRGEPNYTRATEKIKLKSNQKKKKIEGDFEEPDDFEAPVEDKK